MSVVLSVLLGVVVAGSGNTDREKVALADAIADFNSKARADSIGAAQPPLTEEEVIAAIRLWERPTDSPVSDELLAAFKSIAETRRLPENAAFDKLTGYDRGSDYVFDVWSVRIRMERSDGSSFGFILRERAVASRTLDEELKRLKRLVAAQAPSAERFPGWYRIKDRIKELESRIAASKRKR